MISGSARTKLLVWACIGLALATIYLHRREWRLPFPHSHEIATASIAHENGRAYITKLPAIDYDGTDSVMLEEQRRPLPKPPEWSRTLYYLHSLVVHRYPDFATKVWTPIGPGEQIHEDIRRSGTGHFSVWKGQLYFSASDGSDPRTNGRRYRIDTYRLTPGWLRVLIPGLAVGIGLWLAAWYGREIIARHRWLQAVVPGIAISLAMLVVIFAAAEAYFRLAIPFTKVAWASIYHPVAGIIFEPGATIRHTNQTDYWVEQKANSLGFLDVEPALPKPPGTFRIVVIGDSFVEAAQVPIEKKFHVLLGERLREAFPDRKIDVVAMGYSGTGQSAELSFLEAFGKRLAPDLVIVLVVNNDIANNSPVLESVRNGWHPYHTPRLFFEVDPTQPDGFRRIDIEADWQKHIIQQATGNYRQDMVTRLAILRADPAFARKLEGWRFPDDLDFDAIFCSTEELPLVFREAQAITDHVFGEIARMGRRDGFKVLVAAAENVSTCGNQHGGNGRRETRSDAYLRRIRQSAKSAGLELIDLYPTFKAAGDLSRGRFRFDSHWSPTGHELAATGIADYLMRNPAMLAAPQAPASGGR